MNDQIKQMTDEEKNVIGFLEVYLSFVQYLNESNQFNGDVVDFIRQKLPLQIIIEEVALGWFVACENKNKTLYDLCMHYNYNFDKFYKYILLDSLDKALEIFPTLKDFKEANNLDWANALYEYSVQKRK